MDKKKLAWKDHLLKSGLPLEFEVKKFLNSKGCISNMEHTYLRENESQVPTEFSYDIDSSYIKGRHFIDLMIECKYRHESTKWVFLPEYYNSVEDIKPADFMHPIDHFNREKDPHIDFPLEFGPLCSKGIEITSDGANPKTITQAISQLSYAMAEKLTSAMYHQSDDNVSKAFIGTVFYHIPIIITTAKLYRIREDINIENIKLSESIEDIATNEEYLIINGKPGTSLETYNRKIFREFVYINGEEELAKKLNSFSDDLWFVLHNLAKNDCPNSIVVLHHSPDNQSLVEFFNFIERVINPDQEIFDLVEAKQKELDDFFIKFQKDNPGVDLTGGMGSANE